MRTLQAISPSSFRRWPARSKHVAVRLSLLGCSYLAFALTLDLMLWRHGVTTISSVNSSSGSSAVTYTGGVVQSLYEVSPGPITAILVLEATALIVSTLSLGRRVTRRSSKVGVAGVVAAGVIGVVGVVGMLTVGPYILVLAALLLMVALPIDADSLE